MNVGTLTAYFNLDSKDFVTSVKKVESTVDKAANDINASNKRIERSSDSSSRSFKQMAKSIGLVSVAVTALTAATVKAIKSTALFSAELEGLTRKLEFAVGGQEEATSAMEFLSEASNKLGLSLQVSIDQFGSLAAASRGSALEGEETRQTFLALAEAAAVLGLSDQDVERAFTAINQMMSKGKVASEELRLQLGDTLPGALKIMERALGVTSKELSMLLDRGELLSDEVIPLFVAQIRQEMAPAVETLDNTMTAALARLRTAWFELKTTIVESGIGEIVKSIIETFTTALTILDKTIINLKEVKRSLANISFVPLGLDAFNEPAQIEQAVESPLKVAALADSIDRLNEVKQDNVAITNEGVKANSELAAAIDRVRESTEELSKEAEGAIAIGESVLQNFENAIINFVETGTFSFKDFATSIISDMTRIMLKIQVVQPIIEAWTKAISGLGGAGGSTGGILLKGLSKVLGFAKGGVITEKIFGIGMSTGTAYTLGEKGPELVTPLSDMDAAKKLNGITSDAPSKETSSSSERYKNVISTPDTVKIKDIDQKHSSAGKDKALTDLDKLSDSVKGIEQSMKRTEQSSLSQSENGTVHRNEGLASINEATNRAEGQAVPSQNVADVTSNNNITINISAVDSKSLIDLLRDNPDAITVPLSEALSVGDRGLINSIRGAIV
jgi:tape measure domain-containing protein